MILITIFTVTVPRSAKVFKIFKHSRLAKYTQKLKYFFGMYNRKSDEQRAKPIFILKRSC